MISLSHNISVYNTDGQQFGKLVVSSKNQHIYISGRIDNYLLKHSSNLRTRLSVCWSGVDTIRSVLAKNLPASYFPIFSPSDPDADGYSVQVLPSLQVQLRTARHTAVPGQLHAVSNTCSVFHKLMPIQLRLACCFRCMSCRFCSL